jgi:hypothetical protein
MPKRRDRFARDVMGIRAAGQQPHRAAFDMLASLAARNRVSLVNGILSWWDGVELWLSGLGFVLQTIVVMPVVLALAYLIAVVLDAVLGYGITGIRLMRRIRHSDEGPG